MKITALDIGGTAIKYGLFENGHLTHRGETPSEAHKGGPRLMEVAKEVVKNLPPGERIAISTSGQVEAGTGIIRYAGPTIPQYTGFNVKEIFETTFNKPVVVENDVKAAATGEAAYGAGQGVADFLCLAYGTGVGGAIIMGGKVYPGANNSAGEVGQMVTHPEVENGQGFYERYAAASILVANVQRQHPHLTNGREIFAQIENPAVKKIVDAWIHEVLCGISTLAHIFNPTLMVLGGGIMEAPYVLQALNARKLDYLVPGLNNVQLKKAQLGNQAGLYGIGHIALTSC